MWAIVFMVTIFSTILKPFMILTNAPDAQLQFVGPCTSHGPTCGNSADYPRGQK
jgi:hypothetical protein